MYERKFYIPRDTALKAGRIALAEIENVTGCKIKPDVKGDLNKQLAGILSNLQLQGSFLTHAGSEKQIASMAGTYDKPKVIPLRKRYKTTETSDGETK